MLHDSRIIKRNVGIFLTLLCCSFISPLSAHHSAAMFDVENEMKLDGTVTKFQFTNPHVWIHFTVTDENGEETIWRVEALNPNSLKRKGWKRNSFQEGDKITITFYPAKSGKPVGYFVRAITADGTKLGQDLADRER
ncbi:MAG: hypothetical protein ACI9MF_002763 [Gammaproteobacteria bacterium]|jgi:hypothetical protein